MTEFLPVPIHSGPEFRGDPKADLAACKRILAEGSKSFAAASLLLPRRMRDPAAVFYAFCRVADDLVDFSPQPQAAVDALHGRLDRIYRGAPDDDPVDRAFARIVVTHSLPRVIVDALIDGFAWDAEGRQYANMSELLGYCARVASAVGVVMTLFMGARDSRTLARACDLGVAMQLTNIARDVLEDAGRGRLYLPVDALSRRGIDPAAYLQAPTDARIADVIAELLDHADRYYRRADAGIGLLPRDCRPAISAARLIYADIGRVMRARDCDPRRGRAYTGRPRKLALLIRAWVASTPRFDPDARDAPVIPECAFLLAAMS